MDQYSFHGPYAYRWVDHVPIERIDLGSGERRPLRLGERCLLPTIHGCGGEQPVEVCRAAMTAWN